MTSLKKLLSLLLVLSLSFGILTGSQSNFAASTEGVVAMTQNQVVYVALSDAYKEYGGSCKVTDSKAVAKSGKDTVEVDVTTGSYKLNGKAVKVSARPFIKNKNLYVPITFLNEVMDARAAVNPQTKRVEIKRKMDLRYTNNFSVNYLKGGLKAVIDGDRRAFILVPKGKQVPEAYKQYTVIQTPIDSVLAASTTQACHLRALGVIDYIKGVTTKESQWQISEVASALKAGKIKYVGENTAPDYELIKTIKPDVTFTYTGNYGLQTMNTKLKELKLNYVVCNEYLEEDPRGRMEWMKLYGAFFNKEEQAEQLFDKAVANIEKTKQAAKAQKKPKVAWGMFYNGKVYVADPESYVGKMITLAGGDYIYAGQKVGGGTVTLEEFYAKAKDADILIYSSMHQYTKTLEEVTKQAPILAKIKPIQERKVWCFAPNYYQAIDKTDVIIQDLYDIFHKQSKNVHHFIKY